MRRHKINQQYITSFIVCYNGTRDAYTNYSPLISISIGLDNIIHTWFMQQGIEFLKNKLPRMKCESWQAWGSVLFPIGGIAAK